jgi:RNA polymerase sigma factor (sigma-70 family)
VSTDDLDSDLISAAQAGEDYASAFLVSRFGPEVLGYCKSIAGDLSDVDCEAIVGIAIETAVRKVDRFDPARGKFGAWIRGFVLNAVRDWRRAHARLDSLDNEDRYVPEPAVDALGAPMTGDMTTSNQIPSTDNNAEGTLDRLAPVREAVREALPTMRPNDQVIMAMRDLEGRSVEDTAASLKISPDACRQRHHRAKKRLKDILREDPRCAFLLSGDPA